MNEIKSYMEGVAPSNESSTDTPTSKSHFYSHESSSQDYDEDQDFFEGYDAQQQIISAEDGTYSYGDVAKMLEIDPNNLRYYVDMYIDFIKPYRTEAPKRGKYRFSDNSVEVLKTIFKCKENGLKKAEIIEVLKGEAPTPLFGNEDILKYMRDFAEIFAAASSRKILTTLSEQLNTPSDEVLKLTEENGKLTNQILERDKIIEDLIEGQNKMMQEQAEQLKSQHELINEIKEKLSEEKPTSFWKRIINKK